MEIGNFIFGNSRGNYEFPNRSIVSSDEWQDLLESANLDSYGYKEEEHMNDKDTNFRGRDF